MKSSSALQLPPACLAGKLVLVIAGLGRGGAEVQVYELATRLRRRGWQVTVVSILPLTGWAQALCRSGVEVASLDLRRGFPNPWALARFARLIRRLRPDIVHSHMVHANLLTRIARPFAPMPVLVCTAHSINEGGGLRTWLYRVTDRFCDLTTQISEAALARYRQIRATPEDKSRYVPNGVDVEAFRLPAGEREAVRSEFMPRAGFMWLAVGRISKSKDYPTMLAAVSQLACRCPDARLFIVGGGDSTKLQALAVEYGISAQLKFLGLRDDVARLLSAADGLVMSSKNEGLPMALLEAAAAGLPVVATDVGGVAEIVTDATTGFLVPPNNPAALADGMLRLMALAPEERALMGQNSQARVTKFYSLDMIVSRWENLYQDLLQAKVGGEYTVK